MPENSFHFGDIVLANIPWVDKYSGLPYSKIRPVLIISCDNFNNKGSYLVLPISSQPPLRNEIPIELWQRIGLERPSKIQIQPFYIKQP